MATFAPAFTITQSSDGKTLTLVDGSNWVSNDQGYVITNFVRQIVLTDAFDVVIATIPFPTTELTETYALLVDKWIKATYTAVGVVTFTLLQQYAFYRLFQIAYRNAIAAKCGCSVNGIDLCSVDAFLSTALFAIPVGNGVEFQNDIDAANAYLNV